MAGENILVVDDNPTIVHVVDLVLTRAGYNVRSAADGDEALQRAKEQRPDLILLDFIMPKMNGYQFCRALAAEPGLQGVPVVLMSGKAGEVGDRFVKLMGIVDCISKPFSREALQAVVEHALQRKEAAIGSTLEVDIDVAPTPRSSPFDEQTSPRHRLPVGPSERKLDALAVLRESIVETCVDRAVVSARDAQSLRAVLSDALLERIAAPVAQALLFNSEVALEGNLRKVPIGEVLSLLAEQRQWGMLTVMRQMERPAGEAARVDVFFKRGKIELVLADHLSSEFQVGRYLAAAHEISDEELERVIAETGEADREPRPLGTRLVERARVTPGDVKDALSKQARERIYELLRWPAGRFSFMQTQELVPLAVEAALGLSVGEVLMEGFRRVDEWHLIEREVDDFEGIFLRNEELLQDLGRARLERDELIVLDLVNGRNNVNDIVRLSRFASFDVAKLLYRLLATKLIRRRIAPVVA